MPWVALDFLHCVQDMLLFEKEGNFAIAQINFLFVLHGF